jgi:hypothetical protein
LNVRGGEHLLLRLDYRDRDGNSRAKPKGVIACEVRYFCTAARDDDEMMKVMSAMLEKRIIKGIWPRIILAKRTPFTLIFEEDDVAKHCYLSGRWVGRGDECSAWSTIISSSVPWAGQSRD